MFSRRSIAAIARAQGDPAITRILEKQKKKKLSPGWSARTHQPGRGPTTCTARTRRSDRCDRAGSRSSLGRRFWLLEHELGPVESLLDTCTPCGIREAVQELNFPRWRSCGSINSAPLSAPVWLRSDGSPRRGPRHKTSWDPRQHGGILVVCHAPYRRVQTAEHVPQKSHGRGAVSNKKKGPRTRRCTEDSWVGGKFITPQFKGNVRPVFFFLPIQRKWFFLWVKGNIIILQYVTYGILISNN